MTVRFAILGIELFTVTLDYHHAAGTQPNPVETGNARLAQTAKRAAAWWALR